MKTVSSIAAASSVTALSSIGLAIARREHEEKDMSTIATLTAHIPFRNHDTTHHPHKTTFDDYFSATTTTTPSPRLASGSDHGRTLASSSSGASKQVPQKRRSSLIPGVDAYMERSRRGTDGGGGQSRTSSSGGQPTSNPTKWLRRLSSGMSTSRDSSRTSSRPSSAAYTNGSFAASTMPILSDNTSSPQSLPRNRLVKRTASLHSAKGSPTGSRLPVPTFRRPATSHQRSVTLQQESFSSPGPTGYSTHHTGDRQWRHYFTPRISAGEIVMSTRRRSTGIPNPTKRVYPDRRYTPMLVSTKDLGVPATVELDNDLSEQEEEQYDLAGPPAASTASSPFPPQVMHFEESQAPRRSFSISDMLQPQAARRRPSSSRSKPRTLLKARPRVVSEPRAPMGSSFSNISGHESERPAKRRDLTDPKQSQRSLYSSSSSNEPGLASERHQEIDLHLGAEPSLLQFTPDHSLFVQPLSPALTPPHEQQRLPSASHSSTSARPLRLSSAAQSEITSTIGSDSEYRSVGDNSTDYQSDNAYDSIQTRTTRSSSGRRGPHIETIFDDSPPAFSSGRSTKLRDFLGDGQFAGGERFRHSTIEEESSVTSTPVRSVRNRSVTSTPSARPGASQIFSSSPPMMMMPDPDDIDWDASEDEKTDSGLGIRDTFGTHSAAGTPTNISLPFRFGPTLRPSNSRSANSTPQRNGTSPLEKTNLFDWSEQQPSPSHPNRSPPRPRTVHGKKDQDIRGSRPVGRRPVSGMHARSHSVPVVPDLDGKRQNVVANKFGTWGVGSKGVTEDWNEDFDFEDSYAPAHAKELDEKRIDSGHDMFVPKSIREQQENVVANIGLLREWGLLIEELKELRIRAVTLGMLDGRHAQSWREVDAMIELADQESEEHTLEPRRSPPSSPGFDYSAFDDNQSSKRRSQTPAAQTPEPQKFAAPAASPHNGWTETPQATPLTSRPRKDSELVAQSVIAALQSKRNAAMQESADPMTGSRKVPFDTATLRHIVPYVNSLKRKVKDALRETEGLVSSPHRRTSPRSQWKQEGGDEEPPFRNIFKESLGERLPSRTLSRRDRAATDNDDNETSGQKEPVLRRVQRLSFPS